MHRKFQFENKKITKWKIERKLTLHGGHMFLKNLHFPHMEAPGKDREGAGAGGSEM